jgi:hypothetical protein
VSKLKYVLPEWSSEIWRTGLCEIEEGDTVSIVYRVEVFQGVATTSIGRISRATSSARITSGTKSKRLWGDGRKVGSFEIVAKFLHVIKRAP